MSRRRRPQGGNMKLDEFPEEFDDLFFYNKTCDNDSRLPILRGIVYKKFKDAVADRIKTYNDKVPVNDEFEVELEVKDSGFTLFHWSVIRDELLYRGFDPKNYYEDDGTLLRIVVKVERKIDLDKTLKERMKEDCEENSDCESDSETNE